MLPSDNFLRERGYVYFDADYAWYKRACSIDGDTPTMYTMDLTPN